MTYQEAVAELEAIRHSGNLERVRQIIEAYERQPGSSDFLDSSRLLLHACDVLSSHDLGDINGQRDLIRVYAQRALMQRSWPNLEQELRLLAHLPVDPAEATKSATWRRNRLLRSRKWLRALQALSDADKDIGLPGLKASPPAPHLPSGIAAEHVAEGALRRDYRSAIDENRHHADEFALQWHFKRLRRVYEPLASNYITAAYAQEPHDLGELRQLLSEFPIHDREHPRDQELIGAAKAGKKTKSVRRVGGKTRKPS
jgi:hypothetical protein